MIAGLPQFLADYPGMAVRPSEDGRVVLTGTFEFEASAPRIPCLRDAYELTIEIPTAFPKALPAIIENGGKIPRDGHHHVNHDETLCLGSPLRLLLNLARRPHLPGFAESCIVPYLYAISHRLKFGGPFIFDELDHGAPGVLRDYMELFGLDYSQQARAAWSLLGMKKRRANKRPCPCGCSRRLGRCVFNRSLRPFRALASRSWFRANTP